MKMGKKDRKEGGKSLPFLSRHRQKHQPPMSMKTAITKKMGRITMSVLSLGTSTTNLANSSFRGRLQKEELQQRVFGDSQLMGFQNAAPRWQLKQLNVKNKSNDQEKGKISKGDGGIS